MALETITSGAASTVADLDPNSPGNGEDVGQGDDHLRNIKHAIQLTWPNLSDTCSGVASEFAFAHKGGTVSGSAVIKGDLHVQGTLSVSGTIIGAGAVLGTLDVSATISGSAKEAAFARSASFAYSAQHAASASFASLATGATSAVRATSASRALNCTSSNFAASASFAYSANHALSASTAVSAGRAGSASRALNCTSANFAASAGFAASLSGQGALAKLNSVSASEIDAGAVTEPKLADAMGVWVELDATSPAGTGTWSYTSLSSTYKMYKIVATGITTSPGTTALVVEMSISGTFQTTSDYDYGHSKIDNTGTQSVGGGNGSNNIPLIEGTDLDVPTNFEITLFDPASGNRVGIVWDGISCGSNMEVFKGGGNLSTSTSAVDGVRIRNTTGNFSGGTIYLYGLHT